MPIVWGNVVVATPTASVVTTVPYTYFGTNQTATTCNSFINSQIPINGTGANWIDAAGVNSNAWWEVPMDQMLETVPVHQQRFQQRESQVARYQREHHDIEAARQAAVVVRAKELLLRHLTPEQRETFEHNNWFVVEGGRTKTKYRINAQGYSGNIYVLRNHESSHRLCGHMNHDIPLHDQILAQKLWLENDEDGFLAIANRHPA